MTAPSTISLSHDPIRPLNEMLRGIASVLPSLSARVEGGEHRRRGREFLAGRAVGRLRLE